ncbi:hypothetical protein WA158_007765 [Blastocystis sp. Blastoise]
MNQFKKRKGFRPKEVLHKKEESDEEPDIILPTPTTKKSKLSEPIQALAFEEDADTNFIDKKTKESRHFKSRIERDKKKISGGIQMDQPKRPTIKPNIHQSYIKDILDEKRRQFEENPPEDEIIAITDDMEIEKEGEGEGDPRFPSKEEIEQTKAYRRQIQASQAQLKEDENAEDGLQSNQDYISLRKDLLNRYDDLSSSESDEYEPKNKDIIHFTTAIHNNTNNMNIEDENSNDNESLPERVIPSSPPLLPQEDVSSDSDEFSLNKFEKQMIERGRGAVFIPANNNNNYNNNNNQSRQQEETIPTMVSYEKIMNKLRKNLVTNQNIYDNNSRDIRRLENDLEQLNISEQTIEKDIVQINEEYIYTQELQQYIQAFSHCYTKKRPTILQAFNGISQLKKQYDAEFLTEMNLKNEDDVNLLKSKQALITRESPDYIYPSPTELQTSLGVFFKSELYYTKDGKQLRNPNNRDYLDTVYRQKKVNSIGNEVLTIKIRDYLSLFETLFINNEQTYSLLISKIEDHFSTLDSVLEDVSEQFSDYEQILNYFKTLRNQYPEDYKTLYIAQSLPSFLLPLLSIDISHYDPLGILPADISQTELKDMEFMNQLKLYIENTPIEEDKQIIPELFKILIIPYIKDDITYMYNPFISAQTDSILNLLNTLIAENISEAISKDLFLCIYLRLQLFVNDINVFVSRCTDITEEEIIERHYSQAIQLITVILKFKDIFTDDQMMFLISPLTDKLQRSLKIYILNDIYKPRGKMFCNYILSLIPSYWKSMTPPPCHVDNFKGILNTCKHFEE